MKGTNVDGVGVQLIDALRTEDTSGQPDRYALRRLAALIDELHEVDGARPLIVRSFHRAREVADRRQRMASV